MTLATEFLAARRDEDAARLRRALVLRAMVSTGMSQREIASAIGVTQPAVSQQLRSAPDVCDVHPESLLDAAVPVLKTLAAQYGYRRLAVFGSVARGQANANSDIDLIVEAPDGTSTFDFIGFKLLIERVLGRPVDLIEYGGLKPRVDDDIRQEAKLL